MSADPTFIVRQVRWADAAEQLRTVRLAVFVREQGVPEDMEWDGLDSTCIHALATDRQGNAIGTARLLPDGHIGRMAVLLPWRRAGVGKSMLTMLLDIACARGDFEAVLHAQTHAVAFYRRAGFRVSSGEFMEAGIPHVEMRRALRCG
ncbi:MAG: GNAT family N-acetyltransferase [Betaproteobacteria bacterium]|nr:MAG: GNAT family N-acetyltransferase [Betaproteobacteria bacterium]